MIDSHASCSSLRPARRENSVWPMPGDRGDATERRRAHRASSTCRRRRVGTPAPGDHRPSARTPPRRECRCGSRRARHRPGSTRCGCPRRGRPAPPAPGTRTPGAADGAAPRSCTPCPGPRASTTSTSSELHSGHIGRGGCRSRPHSAHRCATSRPSSAASQNAALSSVTIGAGRCTRRNHSS